MPEKGGLQSQAPMFRAHTARVLVVGNLAVPRERPYVRLASLMASGKLEEIVPS